jgi:hypothetical protein
MTVTDGRSSAVFLLLALACAGCVTETKSSDRSSFMSSMRERPADKEKSAGPSRDTTAARSAPLEHDAPEPAPRRTEQAAPKTTPRNTGNPPGPNSRVMFYQPKGDLLLILVNENHTGRTTEAGRLELALNDANRAYKILTDAQMEALLQSLVAQGYDQNATDFVPDDAQYLTAASADLPRYQGLISVERGGSKTKVLGYRRSSEGDAIGLRRYQSYTQLKALVQKWFGDSSRSEYPVGGVSLPR